MRSSGDLRWRRGGYSGRDSAGLPAGRRRGACSRPPTFCSTVAPDSRRMRADRSVGRACRRTAAHPPDKQRGASPGTVRGLPQQIEHLRREHDVAILAALRLLDANDLLCAVDVLDLEPDYLAGAQPAAIAEAEQNPDLEAAGDRQEPAHLIRAQYLRNLLRLADVIDLGRKIQLAQRYAKQKPHSGHDTVAVADAHAGLSQVQLKQTQVLACRGVRRALEKGGQALAAVDVAPLRMRIQLARVHVLDHPLTQRGDSLGCH